jgi:hypothetical protein
MPQSSIFAAEQTPLDGLNLGCIQRQFSTSVGDVKNSIHVRRTLFGTQCVLVSLCRLRSDEPALVAEHSLGVARDLNLQAFLSQTWISRTYDWE